MPFQTEDRTDVWSIGEIDGVWGLNRDVPVTRSPSRNRERGVCHDVEHSNDLIDRVVTKRDRYLFTIGIRGHTVEYEREGVKSEHDGSDTGDPILVEVNPYERAIGGKVLNGHEEVYSFHETKRDEL